ncbi:hypothetical protein HELRODRAFT_161431 [Helobdella robusta]|uniref:Uncharacterized protein n=1 Tax=Helobdella robusta TaxID=6412 RepID=T1ERG7_HELRO|nr:hypothetical protein HELRODRAFT_161431 [Helobdella robusta]ESO02190.1 hypothetical protein HELRODRAFT_161431 [Helobdella robusta]
MLQNYFNDFFFCVINKENFLKINLQSLQIVTESQNQKAINGSQKSNFKKKIQEKEQPSSVKQYDDNVPTISDSLVLTIIRNALALVVKHLKLPYICQPSKHSHFKTIRNQYFIQEIANEIKDELYDLVKNNLELLITVTKTRQFNQDNFDERQKRGLKSNEKIVTWEGAPLMKSNSQTMTGRFIREQLLRISTKLKCEGMLSEKNNKSPEVILDHRFFAAIAEATSAQDIQELSCQLLDGNKVICEAREIVTAFEEYNTFQAKKDELILCLITSLIRTALSTIKDSLNCAAIEMDDILIMCSVLNKDSSHAKKSILCKNVENLIDKYSSDLMNKKCMDYLVKDTVKKIRCTKETPNSDEEISKHIFKAAKRFISKVIENLMSEASKKSQAANANETTEDNVRCESDYDYEGEDNKSPLKDPSTLTENELVMNKITPDDIASSLTSAISKSALRKKSSANISQIENKRNVSKKSDIVIDEGKHLTDEKKQSVDALLNVQTKQDSRLSQTRQKVEDSRTSDLGRNSQTSQKDKDSHPSDLIRHSQTSQTSKDSRTPVVKKPKLSSTIVNKEKTDDNQINKRSDFEEIIQEDYKTSENIDNDIIYKKFDDQKLDKMVDGEDEYAEMPKEQKESENTFVETNFEIIDALSLKEERQILLSKYGSAKLSLILSKKSDIPAQSKQISLGEIKTSIVPLYYSKDASVTDVIKTPASILSKIKLSENELNISTVKYKKSSPSDRSKKIEAECDDRDDSYIRLTPDQEAKTPASLKEKCNKTDAEWDNKDVSYLEMTPDQEDKTPKKRSNKIDGKCDDGAVSNRGQNLNQEANTPSINDYALTRISPDNSANLPSDKTMNEMTDFRQSPISKASTPFEKNAIVKKCLSMTDCPYLTQTPDRKSSIPSDLSPNFEENNDTPCEAEPDQEDIFEKENQTETDEISKRKTPDKKADISFPLDDLKQNILNASPNEYEQPMFTTASETDIPDLINQKPDKTVAHNGRFSDDPQSFDNNQGDLPDTVQNRKAVCEANSIGTEQLAIQQEATHNEPDYPDTQGFY